MLLFVLIFRLYSLHHRRARVVQWVR